MTAKVEAVQIDEVDVVRRALALRKERKIGTLWAECGRFFISESEFDPYGTRVRISLEGLLGLVESIERGPVRKPAASAGRESGAESIPILASGR